MSYQNVASSTGSSKFVQVEPDGTLSELSFVGKRTAVPMGGGLRVTVANVKAALARRVNVAAPGDAPVYFQRNITLSFNDIAGASTPIDDILADLMAHVETARNSYHADDGLVPPTSAVFTDPAG